MRVIASSALVLAASILACNLLAQPDSPEGDRPGVLSQRGQTTPAADEAPPDEKIDFQERLSDVGSKFGIELRSAIYEEVIDAEQAARILKEVEVDFAVRLVRLDLLRVNAKLNKVGDGAPGLPRSAEIQRLREQLRGMLGEMGEPTPAALTVPRGAPAQGRSIGGVKRLD